MDAFQKLLNTLEHLFQKVTFAKLKSAFFVRGVQFSTKYNYKQQIKESQTLEDILDVLDNPLYCNWCNVHLLKKIAENIPSKQAVDLIKIYEDSIHSRKFSDVEIYLSYCFNEEGRLQIEKRFNKNCDNYNNVTVKQLTDYCKELEKSMNIYKSLASPTGMYVLYVRMYSS